MNFADKQVMEVNRRLCRLGQQAVILSCLVAAVQTNTPEQVQASPRLWGVCYFYAAYVRRPAFCTAPKLQGFCSGRATRAPQLLRQAERAQPLLPGRLAR